MQIQRFTYQAPSNKNLPHCPMCGEEYNILLDEPEGKFESCNECGYVAPKPQGNESVRGLSAGRNSGG